MLTWAAVLLGGAVGAVGRFTVTWLIERRSRPALWATFTVNVAGSLVLGLLAGAGTALPGWVGALVGTGFCGALTTYSTFGYETVQLLRTGGKATTGEKATTGTAAPPAGRSRALLNVLATLAVGLGAAALGWQLGSLR